MSARTGVHRARDPLSALLVLDRLEVGPITLRPRSLTAPYRVTRGARTWTTELSYRYEEDVFHPGEGASRNLAALIAAQVALNYGLFAREIRFHGAYDAHDRAFLAEMAEITAREILVKKFLEPNPFLTGAARGISPPKKGPWLRARLVFDDAPGDEAARTSRAREASLPAWRPAPPGVAPRYAVLSSGGKESLLTWALLEELGADAHPIFVNESGRHWFTALNGYRHFAATVPQTARVWTSADRVFNWMLQRLPFIRRDFARVRADDYPIRLWTVAVFLFGTLPLVRKRGLERLLIGDEFDTTRRASTRGIPHHAGLYDQSLDFDRALTAFYEAKGWPLVQFSALRPLSEYLVQKILVERYPELQRDQVSCHAAHVREGRVYPCGRCEKCRRVVGLLSALGADPARSGYPPATVARVMRELAQSGDLHQETGGVEHMFRRLVERHLIPKGAPAAKIAREHPEIEALRFDPRVSPPDAVPADLAGRLYAICRDHAGGTLRRAGKGWEPLDLAELKSGVEGGAMRRRAARMSREARDAGKAAKGRKTTGASGAAAVSKVHAYLLAELSWPQALARFRETDTALLPVGAIEQHGPHLPLDLDAWDAEHLARETARRVTDPKPLVLPLVPYGVSYHHDEFSGTLSVSAESLAGMVYDLGMSVSRHGIAKLVIVNGHGGNVPALQYAAQMINRDARIFTCVETGDTSDADVARVIETPNDVHAGEIETSTALAARPELVNMEAARRFVPRFSSQYLNFSSMRSVEWYARTARISPTGILGDPTRATREKGERIWELMIGHLAAFVETLKGMSLEEIHQKQY